MFLTAYQEWIWRWIASRLVLLKFGGDFSCEWNARLPHLPLGVVCVWVS